VKKPDFSMGISRRKGFAPLDDPAVNRLDREKRTKNKMLPDSLLRHLPERLKE